MAAKTKVLKYEAELYLLFTKRRKGGPDSLVSPSEVTCPALLWEHLSGACWTQEAAEGATLLVSPSFQVARHLLHLENKLPVALGISFTVMLLTAFGPFAGKVRLVCKAGKEMLKRSSFTRKQIGSSCWRSKQFSEVL